MTWLRGGDKVPELPERLATYREWEWDGDMAAWASARNEWERCHMTTKEIAGAMERKRLSYRAETLRRWRERQEADND